MSERIGETRGCASEDSRDSLSYSRSSNRRELASTPASPGGESENMDAESDRRDSTHSEDDIYHHPNHSSRSSVSSYSLSEESSGNRSYTSWRSSRSPTSVINEVIRKTRENREFESARAREQRQRSIKEMLRIERRLDKRYIQRTDIDYTMNKFRVISDEEIIKAVRPFVKKDERIAPEFITEFRTNLGIGIQDNVTKILAFRCLIRASQFTRTFQMNIDDYLKKCESLNLRPRASDVFAAFLDDYWKAEEQDILYDRFYKTLCPENEDEIPVFIMEWFIRLQSVYKDRPCSAINGVFQKLPKYLQNWIKGYDSHYDPMDKWSCRKMVRIVNLYFRSRDRKARWDSIHGVINPIPVSYETDTDACVDELPGGAEGNTSIDPRTPLKTNSLVPTATRISEYLVTGARKFYARRIKVGDVIRQVKMCSHLDTAIFEHVICQRKSSAHEDLQIISLMIVVYLRDYMT